MGQRWSFKGNAKHFELKENENITSKIWDAAKVVLRGKFKALNLLHLNRGED